MQTRAFGLIISAIVMTSCNKPADYSARISALDDRVKKVEGSQQWDDIMQESEGSAFLKTSETTYGMLKADFGNVAASIENISDYADGAKVVIRLGNTTSATANGLKANLEWGQLNEQGVVTGQKRTKEEMFTDALPAGSWHNYQIILPGMPPSKIGYLRITNLQSTTISLLTR